MNLSWMSACAVLLFTVASVSAQTTVPPPRDTSGSDWPHWAGPNGNCTSDETGLLKEWPKDGPKVVWRIPVGVGSNHPSVAGDDLCYAELDGTQSKETVRCVDANTGKEKWSYTYDVPPVYSVGWGELGVRATPTITDQYVYEVGTFGNAFCFERATGKVVWQHDLREYSPYLNGSIKGGGNLEWKGFNGSLIPIGDKIIMFYWQGGLPAVPAWAKTEVSSKMQVFAFDANTGKMVWKFEEDCKPGTRGPGLITGGVLPLKFKNEDCVVLQGNREWKILRQSDGRQVWNWECSGPQDSPAWACGGLGPVGKNLYFNAPNGWVLSLMECDFSQADPKPKALWSSTEVHEAITPCVVLDGYVYGFFVDKREQAWGMGDKPEGCNFSLRCTDLKTGKLVWKQPGFFMGLSMAAADGRLYVRSYQTLTLLEPTPNGYVEKGRIDKVHDVSNAGRQNHRGLLDWCMPVISNGRLFIRTPLEIICYDIKDPNAPKEAAK